MENQTSPNLFNRFRNWTKRNCNVSDQTGSQENPDGFTSESRIQEVQRAERAERAALTRCAERLCNAQNARTHSVLERLCLSPHVPQPSPQPPAVPRRGRKLSAGGQGFCPLLDSARFEDIKRNQKSWDEEDDDPIWDKIRLGSYIAALACKETPMADGDKRPTASVSPPCSLTPDFAHTPHELRAIPLVGTPPPPPMAPLSRRQVSHLPVLTTRLSRKNKEVANGSVHQTPKNKVQNRLEQLHHLPQPPAAPKGIPVKAPVVPLPPKVPQTKSIASRPGKILRPAQIKKTEASSSIKSINNNKKVEVQPLKKPPESLSLCFELLSSDDWMKKIKGLETITALAQHHSETLQTKLHEVCLVLIEEVNNLRSAVACAAMNTLAELYTGLQKTMDPEVEGTGRALLLKLAQTTNAFIHQQANLALDALVENCSHGRIISALLNTGMSHRCAAVRSSMAQHLHQLSDRLGAAHLLTLLGKSVAERFLTAVSKMSVDAAPEVRHHGQTILLGLVVHRDFMSLWTKIVPEKDRRPLDKIIKKAKN